MDSATPPVAPRGMTTILGSTVVDEQRPDRAAALLAALRSPHRIVSGTPWLVISTLDAADQLRQGHIVSRLLPAPTRCGVSPQGFRKPGTRSRQRVETLVTLAAAARADFRTEMAMATLLGRRDRDELLTHTKRATCATALIRIIRRA